MAWTSGAKLLAGGTTGTPCNDRIVAVWWQFGLALLVLCLPLSGCGGESRKGSDTSSGQNGSPSDSSSATNAASGGASSSSTSSSGGTRNSAVTTTRASETGMGGGSTTSGNMTSGAGGLGGAGGSSGEPTTCEAQDARGFGDCDRFFGVYFLGSRCGRLIGCGCEGTDCDRAYQDEGSCEKAHRGCLTQCAAQDITFVGGCESASIFVFNGIDCVAMDGCQCVGADCNGGYTTLEACEEAHAACVERERACEDIQSVYAEYVGHTACQDDSDCVIVSGQCGIGLGGCHHAVNRGWGEQGLSDLGEVWLDSGCSGPVCDCDAPPQSAFCDAGVCTPLQ